MNSQKEPLPVISGVEDRAILFPCFRYSEVKEAVSHIALKLGFIDRTTTSIPYLFFYASPDKYLHIMVTPVCYDCNQMCYAFRYIVVTTRPVPIQEDSSAPYLLSEWHSHPRDLFIDLVQGLWLIDSGRLKSSPATRDLTKMRRDPKAGDAQDISDHIPGRTERDLLWALEENGFEFSTFAEVISLSFWGVTPVFLCRLAAYGYTHFSMEEICIAWRSKIPPWYLKGFAAAGYNHFRAEEYEIFHAFDIDPAYVGMLSNRGLKNLSAEELIRVAHYGESSDRLLQTNIIDRRST